MIYEKATAEVILFDNSDVIRTSGGSCKNKGQDNGNGCKKQVSGNCPGQHWRGENGLNEWRANRAGL